MENDITLEALDAITNADDTADNSVKKIKDGVKRYSERLNNDRQTMWEETRMNFSSGAYGDPQSLETLKMYWQTMYE